MSSDKNYGTIATQQGTAVLTAAYGDESAGWTTKGIDVSMFDWLSVEFSFLQKQADLLSIKPLAGEREAADLDAYVDLYHADSAGALAVLEVTLDVSGITSDVTTKGVLPPIDVRGLSMLRLAANADDVTSSPTLSLRYMGHRLGRGESASPDVA